MARVAQLLSCHLFVVARIIAQDVQQCTVSKVHVTNEDGLESTFRMKRIKGSETCDGDKSDGRQLATSRDPALRPPVMFRLGDLLPSVDRDSKFKGWVACEDQTECATGFDGTATQNYADFLIAKSVVPYMTGNRAQDRKVGYGIVLVQAEQLDEAIQYFTRVLKSDPDLVGAYYGRGAAHARKGLHDPVSSQNALKDLGHVIKLDGRTADAFERRAEVYITLGEVYKALSDIKKAMNFRKKSARLYFVRGITHLVAQNFTQAEADFKRALDLNVKPKPTALYHLGLTLFSRGKVRNSVHVFQEALDLDPDNRDLSLALGQAYKELGEYSKALHHLTASTRGGPANSYLWEFRGLLNYQSGRTLDALGDFQLCLKQDASNTVCRYYCGLSHAALGQHFSAVKDFTKVIVYDNRGHKRVTPEFLKSHYLREYSRYLHTKLDEPIVSLNLESDLTSDFLVHWVKQKPFNSLKDYKDQPGIQPLTRDVQALPADDITKSVRRLLCRSQRVGSLGQVNTDGFLPSRRLNLVMGLASIHIAQYMVKAWSRPRSASLGPKATWEVVHNIAVQYRRMVDPEAAVVWLNKLKNKADQEYETDITFIKGHVVNTQRIQYFDLIFKLFRALLLNNGASTSKIKTLNQPTTAEDLLQIAKKETSNNHLYMSTQVQSIVENIRHYDGVTLALTEDQHRMPSLSLSLVTTKSRTTAFQIELDFLFNKIFSEVRKSGLSKIVDFEALINLILSLAYYFYNLMPLSRGTSAVAYSVMAGLLMSVGREISGKIPAGKLMDLEAMLSGAPDAFILVAKQWMAIRKMSEPVSSLPQVWEALPTIRNVLEVLNIDTDHC